MGKECSFGNAAEKGQLLVMETYSCYQNVLGESTNREIYYLALSKREHFTRSKTSPSKLYPDWRRSTVIFDGDFVDVASRLDHEIRLHLQEVIAALRIPAFDIGPFEFQLTSHNHGEYYKWHTDNGTRETEARVMTFVYYFHKMPKGFSGGELVINSGAEQAVVIEPENDTLLFFRSHTRHEVKEVVCPSRQFEDGRFTINGWIRRKALPYRPDYFDEKIFRLPVRIGRRISVESPTTVQHSRGDSLVAPLATRARTEHRNSPVLTPPDDFARLLSLMTLYSDLHRQSVNRDKIHALRKVSHAEFYEDYYFLNRPVIYRGLVSSSVAVRTWSPELFAEKYGSVPVQITVGRERIPNYEINYQQTVRTIMMTDFVHRLRQNGETNDFYLVARNHFFDIPALRHLRNDLEPPPEIINTKDQGPGTAKGWFGPKGTITPLHYDEHSILFMQIYGRKQFKLVPSFEFPKMYVQNTYYSAVDPENVNVQEHPKFLQASLADVVLEPGDLLFIPVGWWHWAKSLDVSISATFCSFRVQDRNTSHRTP